MPTEGYHNTRRKPGLDPPRHQATLADMVNPELTVNGHHIVKDIYNNGKLTGRVEYHKQVKEMMFIRSAHDDDEPEEYVETGNTQGVTLVVRCAWGVWEAGGVWEEVWDDLPGAGGRAGSTC